MSYHPHYAIVPATAEFIEHVIANLRDDDAAEVKAQSGMHPAMAIGTSVGASERVYAGLVDGTAMCLFGVATVDGLDGVGSPWMVGTDLVVKHQRKFLRECHGVVADMLDDFRVLENHVDARNTTSIRWLSWLGFDIFATVPHGPYGLPFHPFRMVRE